MAEQRSFKEKCLQLADITPEKQDMRLSGCRQNARSTADHKACADKRQETSMKAYISVALVVPVLASCAACAEAPYASAAKPEKKVAFTALPARKPAFAPASAGVFISTPAPAPANASPEGTANSPASSEAREPAASRPATPADEAPPQ